MQPSAQPTSSPSSPPLTTTSPSPAGPTSQSTDKGESGGNPALGVGSKPAEVGTLRHHSSDGTDSAGDAPGLPMSNAGRNDSDHADSDEDEDEDDDEDTGEDDDAAGDKTVLNPSLDGLSDVADLIRSGRAKNIIIMAGAGISTAAGIPDFRSPETGLYANLQKFNLPVAEAIFDIDFFRKNPEPFFVLCKDLFPGKHLPTATHYFFRLLHEKGLLRRVFTQNSPSLPLPSPLHITHSPSLLLPHSRHPRIPHRPPPSLIIEAHGSFARSHCISPGCGREYDNKEMERRVRGGEVVRCGKRGCGGLVKPDIVFFGEGLPERFFQLAATDFPECDLLIVIGTSLKVHPFASLIDSVPPHCPRLLINREAVAVSHSRGKWDDGFVLEEGSRDWWEGGEADGVVWELCGELGWEEELKVMVETHQAELKERWGMKETKVGSKPDDTIDELADDLKKAGLEEK